MSVTTAIASLKSEVPVTAAEAKAFLDSLTADVQEQLIAAVYLGREHIHSTALRQDLKISRSYTDQIAKEDYPRILHEKGENVSTYLSKLEECATASGFDLNAL